MAVIRIIYGVLFLLFTHKVFSSEDIQDLNNQRHNSEKENFNIKDSRLGHNLPDIRVVLNDLLRYENSMRLPSESDHIMTLSSKGAVINGDDPLTMLASGFHGSRGKRPSYDEIPVFANGFPANRGKRPSYDEIPVFANGFPANRGKK